MFSLRELLAPLFTASSLANQETERERLERFLKLLSDEHDVSFSAPYTNEDLEKMAQEHEAVRSKNV